METNEFRCHSCGNPYCLDGVCENCGYDEHAVAVGFFINDNGGLLVRETLDNEYQWCIPDNYGYVWESISKELYGLLVQRGLEYQENREKFKKMMEK